MYKSRMESFLTTVIWNPDYNWFQGVHILSNESQIEFNIRASGKEDTATLCLAEVSFGWICENIDQLLQSISDKLFNLYKDDWEQGGASISIDEFANSFHIELITVTNEKNWDIYWSAESLFGNHMIFMEVSKLKIGEVQLEG